MNRQMVVPASARTRVMAFLEAFAEAPNDADIEVRVGANSDGRPAVIVNIGGGNHGLLVDEARKVADIMEETMNALPNEPEAATLPNIIMALRYGCDEAERSTHNVHLREP